MSARADRAADVARFLVEECSPGDHLGTLQAMRGRWPASSAAEFDRAFAIAEEFMLAKIAEGEAEVTVALAALDGLPRQ